jgi:MHS family alpha-ketoglutarate permease-like MFS transporter
MSSATATAATHERISGKRLHAIIVGSAGNLVEWFDFYCYSAFALYFANAFFPAQDPTAQLMSTAGIFALGFFIRPIGGMLFGHIGDRLGRKTALMASVLLMCFGSLLIACAPTYATAGILSPCILLLARLLQGLSLGGEYGASATYLSEMADSKHRGFYSSFQYVTLIGGQLLALILLLVLQKFLLSAEELRAWGWRIPFFVGAALAVLALRMRHNLPETQSLKPHANPPRPWAASSSWPSTPEKCCWWWA